MTETTAFPKGPIVRVSGRGLVLRGDDIDTDRIIPACFLKCVSFEALGEQAFAHDRLELDGAHPFDRDVHQGASILVVTDNFGCGSSREHAPQALMRWGIRALIGESFAEIFFGNCLALGIPCLSAEADTVRALQEAIATDPGAELQLDLEALEVELESEFVGASRWTVYLDPGPHQMLVSGQWDATGQLLANDALLLKTLDGLPYGHGF